MFMKACAFFVYKTRKMNKEKRKRNEFKILTKSWFWKRFHMVTAFRPTNSWRTICMLHQYFHCSHYARQIFELQEQLKDQFAIRCALKKALACRSVSVDGRTEELMPKVSTSFDQCCQNENRKRRVWVHSG